MCHKCGTDDTIGKVALEHALQSALQEFGSQVEPLVQAIQSHKLESVKGHDVKTAKGQTTRLSRFINRQIKPDLSESEVERFCNFIAAKLVPLSESFTILKGNAIEEAYDNCVGGSSCMTGDRSSQVRMYAENDDRISLVVWKGDQARALLWHTNEGNMVLDRVYPSNGGEHVQQFIDYAKQNGWDYRIGYSIASGQSYSCDLNAPSNNEYPYCDTFNSGDKVRDGKFTVYTCGGDYSLNNTDGSYDGDRDARGGTTCTDCNDRVDEDDCSYVDDHGYVCECCMSDYVHDDFSHCYIRADDAVQYVDTDRWVYDGDAYRHGFQCNGTNDWYEEADSVEVDGDTYHIDYASEHFYLCDDCCEYHTECNEVDGESYCNDCVGSHGKQCGDCKEWHSDCVTPADLDGDTYCVDCVEKIASLCLESDQWFCNGCPDCASESHWPSHASSAAQGQLYLLERAA